MLSDSDYVPDGSDITTVTSEEEETPETIIESIFDTWEEDDVNELTNNLYSLMDEYYETNLLYISSPKFYTDMLEYICQIIFHDLLAGNLCHLEDYDEIYEFAENTLEVYLDFSNQLRRSISYMYTIPEKKNNDIEILMKKIHYLETIPQPKQKTKEWYEFRYNMISASNLWKALGSESNQNSLIYEKCIPFDIIQTNSYSSNTESAMHWGNKYEQVTVMIYENMYNTKVGEFGCIRHQKYTYIGASPDGINIDKKNQRYGRMIEIKNVVNRDITGIPKEEYWVQTQIQMEVCDLDECDFVETRFLEYPTADAFYDDNEHDYRGVILCFIERNTVKNSAPTYIYLPLDICLDNDTINEWIAKQKKAQKENGLVLLEIQYWYLAEISCVYIPRNRKWFALAIPKIEQIWNIIQNERITGYEHRAPKKKQIKNTIQVTNDSLSSSYMVQNLPLANSVCLIKLDEDGNVI